MQSHFSEKRLQASEETCSPLPSVAVVCERDCMMAVRLYGGCGCTQVGTIFSLQALASSYEYKEVEEAISHLQWFLQLPEAFTVYVKRSVCMPLSGKHRLKTYFEKTGFTLA